MIKFAAMMVVAAAMTLGTVGESVAARLVAQVNLSTQTMTVKKDGKVIHR